jgi:signal transduction histidine kinase
VPSSGASETPYIFAHTFAAPFDSVRATLRLRPLADPDDGTLVAKLAFLIPLCVLVGLIALYRLAAAQVRFAERRSNFVAAVSHELKTPLTAIRMHAEMLEEDLVDGAPKRHEYYRTITRESERLSRLIDNVLTFAQLERKSHRLETRVGDISGVVRESIDVLRPHVQAHAFSIELELPTLPTLLPDVRFEPDALKQVLFNLVDNALKYARDGAERRIIVRCEPEAGGVALSVCDRGPGVRRDQLKTIFQPFFRGENELTRKNQGTGLGLSLVQGLAGAMGASVRCENTHPGFAVRVHLVPD